MFALLCCRTSTNSLGNVEKYQLYRELKTCLEIVEPVEGKQPEEMVNFCIEGVVLFSLIHLILLLFILIVLSSYLGRKNEICNVIFEENSFVPNIPGVYPRQLLRRHDG